ncbi:MAG: S8 family serine peptidase, partial [Pseudomonadota bacterium]
TCLAGYSTFLPSKFVPEGLGGPGDALASGSTAPDGSGSGDVMAPGSTAPEGRGDTAATTSGTGTGTGAATGTDGSTLASGSTAPTGADGATDTGDVIASGSTAPDGSGSVDAMAPGSTAPEGDGDLSGTGTGAEDTTLASGSTAPEGDGDTGATTSGADTGTGAEDTTLASGITAPAATGTYDETETGDDVATGSTAPVAETSDDGAPADDPALASAPDGGGDGDGGGPGGAVGEEPDEDLRRAAADVVIAPDGTPQYVAVVPSQQVPFALSALAGVGATVLGRNELGNLEQTILTMALPQGLSRADARALMLSVAPGAVFDMHHIYRRAAGPRVYHPTMLGDAPGQSCSVANPVRVGIIDGPVDPVHPALRDVVITRESFIGSDQSPGTPGHGTAVAGLIAGGAASGPLAGLAPGVEIYSAEAFGIGERGDGAELYAVAESLDWLIGNGVGLINMSFAGHGNDAFARLLESARAKGVVIVAAAGNDRSDAPFFPAASPDTIAVTAVDASGRIYRRANFGDHIEFAAPGVDLYVAWGDLGSYRSGTSFSTPVVTALLARQAAQGHVTLQDAREALRTGVRDLGPGGRDENFGFGLVQSGGC